MEKKLEKSGCPTGKDKRIKTIVRILYYAVLFIVIVFLGKQMAERQMEINNLKEIQVQTEDEYARTEEELTKECADAEGVYEVLSEALHREQKLQEDLALWMQTRENGNTAFYGCWTVQEDNAEKKDCREIVFRKDYIMFSEKRITNRPVYHYNVKLNWDVWDSLAEMGFDYHEVSELFSKDYYAELMLDRTEDWNEQPGDAESEFIYGKYFLVDEHTMWYFTQNDGGKMYVLKR